MATEYGHLTDQIVDADPVHTTPESPVAFAHQLPAQTPLELLKQRLPQAVIDLGKAAIRLAGGGHLERNGLRLAVVGGTDFLDDMRDVLRGDIPTSGSNNTGPAMPHTPSSPMAGQGQAGHNMQRPKTPAQAPSTPQRIITALAAGGGGLMPRAPQTPASRQAPAAGGNGAGNSGSRRYNQVRQPFDLDRYEDNLRSISADYETWMSRLSTAYDQYIPTAYNAMGRGATPQQVEAQLRPSVGDHSRLVDQLMAESRTRAGALLQEAHSAALQQLTEDERAIINGRFDARGVLVQPGIRQLLDERGSEASGRINIMLQRIGDPLSRRYAEIVLHDYVGTVIERTHWDNPQDREGTNALIGSLGRMLQGLQGKHPDPGNRENTKTRTLAFGDIARIWVDAAERRATEDTQRSRLNASSTDYATLAPVHRAPSGRVVRDPALAIQEYMGLREHTMDKSHYTGRAATGDIAARVIGDIDQIVWQQGDQVWGNVRGNRLPLARAEEILVDILRSASSQQAAELIYYCITGRQLSSSGNTSAGNRAATGQQGTPGLGSGTQPRGISGPQAQRP